ncbi:MAG: hypothetical protein NVS9B9_22920 [Ktedonobacteraceae bacterium]
MRTSSRNFVIGVVGFEVIIIFFMLNHLGGIAWQFSQLLGAIVGGTIALVSVNRHVREGDAIEPMLGRERLAWTLVGCGLISWGIGESFWRYYILTNQSPFPSYADFGYSGLPPLILAGMLLQPSSGSGRRRSLILLDSLISMGAILAIGWYLLLGDLALHSTVENPLAKFLGLYYPTTDVALLSCVAILLLRGQGRLYQATARRISLIVVGIGLCFFAASDFAFNLLQNAGTYIEGTWVDLGWPLGLTTIGLAVYLRRFLPHTSTDQIEMRLRRRAERVTFGPEQFVPYILLGVLFVVLILNVISADPGQRDIRPILLMATLCVVGLVVVRQILTQVENGRLARRQADALERLEAANQRVEEQARMIAERNDALEMGVNHLKDVQARLANGNLRARARLSDGELLPLAASLNLMADRLMRLERTDIYAQRLTKALAELSIAIERYRNGAPFMMPASSNDFTEVNRLLLALGLKEKVEYSRVAFSSTPSESLSPRLQSGTITSQPLQPEQLSQSSRQNQPGNT